MNWLDVVLILILGASVVTSLRKGLSREIIGLVTVVAALLLAIWFYGTAGTLFKDRLSSPAAEHFAGFVVVFCVVLLAGWLVSALVGKFLKVTGLSFFDHLLGAGFGLARGLLIAIALIMGLMAFSSGDRPPRAVVDSRAAPYVVDAARVAASMAPHELREGFRKTYAQVRSAWDKALDQLPGREKGQNERKI